MLERHEIGLNSASISGKKLNHLWKEWFGKCPLSFCLFFLSNVVLIRNYVHFYVCYGRNYYVMQNFILFLIRVGCRIDISWVVFASFNWTRSCTRLGGLKLSLLNFDVVYLSYFLFISLNCEQTIVVSVLKIIVDHKGWNL